MYKTWKIKHRFTHIDITQNFSHERYDIQCILGAREAREKGFRDFNFA